MRSHSKKTNKNKNIGRCNLQAESSDVRSGLSGRFEPSANTTKAPRMSVVLQVPLPLSHLMPSCYKVYCHCRTCVIPSCYTCHCRTCVIPHVTRVTAHSTVASSHLSRHPCSSSSRGKLEAHRSPSDQSIM